MNYFKNIFKTEKQKNIKSISRIIREFYNQYPFPDFDMNKYNYVQDLNEHSKWFFKLLDQYIPNNSKIADVGCGTGQFSCFLGAKGRDVYAFDFSEESIDKAKQLKNKLKLDNVKFEKKDLFELNIPDNSFDYTFCLGVLHHTPEPYRGYKNLVRITKHKGYIVIVTINPFGRLYLKFRRLILKYLIKSSQQIKNYFTKKHMGQDENDNFKLISWYYNLYEIPYESNHTIGEVMKWLKTNKVSYINSFPPIELFKKTFYSDYPQFQPNPFKKDLNKYFDFLGFSRVLKRNYLAD